MDKRPRAHFHILVAAAILALVAPAATWAQQAAVTVLHAFAGTDGALPRASLIHATDGNFYGTTFSGGATSTGTIYMMTLAGSVTVLHAFMGGADGANPRAALIQATDGNFYGTTYSGGAASSGTVFK